MDVDVDEVPSEEAIRLGLETQLTDGLRVLELCGQVSNASNASKGSNGGSQKLRVPKPEGGLAADERMMLAGGRDDDDSRLAYEDDGDGFGGERDANGHGSSAERGDAIRWFMFPSEASHLLANAIHDESKNGVLPL